MPAFNPNPRPEPTILGGYRGPEDHVSERVVADMSKTILRYMPETTPFLTLSSKIKGSRTAINFKHEWLEKDFKPRKVTVVGAQTDVDVTIEFSSADLSKIAARDVIRFPRTGEVILVSAVNAGDVTAVRGIGGGNLALNDGETGVILGPSYPDNATLGTMKSITEYPNFNYTEIIRTPFGFSGRDVVTELYGGNDVDNETKWQAVEHKRSIEYRMYFGRRHLIAAAGSVKQQTFMGGLEYGIQSNIWNVKNVTLNERVFNEFLEEGLRWGRGGRQQGGAAVKYLLHSSRWGTEFSSWIDGSKLQYRVLDKTIGFAAKEYLSPHGRVMFVPSVLLDEYHPDYAFLVDFNHLDSVTLRERGTKLLRGREANDLDGEAYEYFSDLGVEVRFEQAHALLKGLGT